ncbi:DUF3617 family protein [Sphingomonas sp.]|uniref:DUF3617 domain-containing protein n=1 Tax=Sphingomonas sp. TaxID=28214 RepID=UPI00286A3298|nr:DUF3617 family protein [Sphingomonas sp.]
MRGGSFRVVMAAVAAGGTLALIGAVRAVEPGGIAAAQPGLWDVSRSATGAKPVRVCLADPAWLAQWEDRGAACKRELLTEQANVVTFDYRCTGGAFGRAEMTLLTPRSLKVHTQGISGGLPFDETLYARRAGNCPQTLSTRLPSRR